MKHYPLRVSGILLVLAVILSFAIPVALTSCGENTSGDGLQFTLQEDGQSYYVSGAQPRANAGVEIPAVYQGKPVTGIGEYAFYNREDLTDIVIPDSVTRIGNYAFYHCNGLTEVVLPDSVSVIGRYAFSHCDRLTNVTLSVGVTDIGVYAFGNCGSLEKIEVAAGNGVYHSEGNCLIETESKTLLVGCRNSVIPHGVTQIAEGAFSGCEALEHLDLPDSVTRIGNGAFSDTGYYKKEANWENGVLYLGKHLIRAKNGQISESCQVKPGTLTIADGAFYDCSNLTQIVIPDSVVSIGEEAFRNCKNLQELHFPNSVSDLGKLAFSYCGSLKSVELPAGVTSLADGLFWACGNLTQVKISNSVTSIGDSAFYWCGSLTDLTYSGTQADWKEMPKGENWDHDTAPYTVHCTDGDLEISD